MCHWVREPKAGEKKKGIFSTFNVYLCDCFLSATGAVTNHLMKNHKQEWDAYCEMRARTKGSPPEIVSRFKGALPVRGRGSQRLPGWFGALKCPKPNGQFAWLWGGQNACQDGLGHLCSEN